MAEGQLICQQLEDLRTRLDQLLLTHTDKLLQLDLALDLDSIVLNTKYWELDNHELWAADIDWISEGVQHGASCMELAKQTLSCVELLDTCLTQCTVDVLTTYILQRQEKDKVQAIIETLSDLCLDLSQMHDSAMEVLGNSTIRIRETIEKRQARDEAEPEVSEGVPTEHSFIGPKLEDSSLLAGQSSSSRVETQIREAESNVVAEATREARPTEPEYFQPSIGMSSALYNPLGRWNFRLLRIHPIQNYESYESPVLCEMVVVNPSLMPKYTIISHVWSYKDLRAITVQGVKDYNSGKDLTSINDVKLPVSWHLLQGLRRFRQDNSKPPRVPAAEYVFVDQICVNQADVSERSQYVRILPVIYSQAVDTIIWLGEHDAQKSEKPPPSCDLHSPEAGESDIKVCTAVGPPNSQQLGHSMSWEERDLFLGHRFQEGPSWWHRVWSIQEFVLSGRIATVWIGPHAFTWETLMDLVKRHARRPDDVYFSTHLKRLQDLRASNRGRDPNSIRLPELLQITSDYRSLDARDRIYCLLNIIRLDVGTSKMNVDYNDTAVEVYEEATVAMIEDDASLDILLESTSNRQTLDVLDPRPAGLPDWVPQFERLLGVRESPRMPRRTSSHLEAQRQALGVRLMKPPVTLTRALGFRAIEVDKVHKWMRPLLFFQGLASVRPKLSEALASDPVQKLPFGIGSKPQASDIMLQVTYNGVLPSSEARSPLWKNWPNVGTNFPSHGPSAMKEDSAPATSIENLDKSRAARLEESFVLKLDSFNNTNGQVLFVTERGFWGVGPSSIRKHDIVVLPLGATNSLVFRQGVAGDSTPISGIAWKLVGGVEIPAIMAGEMMDAWRRGAVKDTTILLD